MMSFDASERTETVMHACAIVPVQMQYATNYSCIWLALHCVDPIHRDKKKAWYIVGCDRWFCYI